MTQTTTIDADELKLLRSHRRQLQEENDRINPELDKVKFDLAAALEELRVTKEENARLAASVKGLQKRNEHPDFAAAMNRVADLAEALRQTQESARQTAGWFRRLLRALRLSK